MEGRAGIALQVRKKGPLDKSKDKLSCSWLLTSEYFLSAISMFMSP